MRQLWIGCVFLLAAGCAAGPGEPTTEESLLADATELQERAGNGGGPPQNNNGGGGRGPNGGGEPTTPNEIPLPVVVAESPAEQEVRRLLRLPDHLPTPIIPKGNPLSSAKIELGHHLFYDHRLSVNQRQACSSCHQQEFGFADNRVLPRGTTGEMIRRNSQGLSNVAFYPTLTWSHNNLLDLEHQLLIPLTGDDPIELGLTPENESEILERLQADSEYSAWFTQAFPEETSTITVDQITRALASFTRFLVSGDSPFDRFQRGDTNALTAQQQEGMRLFNGQRFGCAQCHGGINQTISHQDTRAPMVREGFPFFNIGLYNLDGKGSYPANDQGIFDLTGDPGDRGLFRPPSLRNVAVSPPYMHDGSLPNLRAVLRHYRNGGTVINEGPNAGDGRQSPLKSELIRPFRANQQETDAVIAFLEGLTDPTFLSDPAFANPWPENHPAQGLQR
jgi:cytochrome c peroxidase